MQIVLNNNIISGIQQGSKDLEQLHQTTIGSL